MGRYPHDFYYFYHCFVLTAKLLIKFILYKMKGWHYFMTEFCYTGASVQLIYMMLYPKDETLFVTAFLFSNGALSIAVVALGN